MKRHPLNLGTAILGIAWAVLFVCIGGCAAGRGPAGEVIVGWDVAQLPETAGEMVNAAAGFLPPPFNYLAGAAGLALTAYAAKKKGEELGWDQAVGKPPQAQEHQK